jgi:hypothetical protein
MFDALKKKGDSGHLVKGEKDCGIGIWLDIYALNILEKVLLVEFVWLKTYLQ